MILNAALQNVPTPKPKHIAYFLMFSVTFQRSLAAHHRWLSSAFLRPTRTLQSGRGSVRVHGSADIRQRRLLVARAARNPNSRLSRLRRFSNTSRPLPGTFDSWDYDDEFGGFDYTPDEYDLQDMNEDNGDIGEDLVDEVAMDDTVGSTQSQKDNSTISAASPASRPTRSSKAAEMASVSETSVNIIDASNENVRALADTEDYLLLPEQKSQSPETYATILSTSGHQSTTRPVREMVMSTELDRLEEQLQIVRQTICDRTSNPNFNPNSPRQVSIALFSEPGMSTNKDVLEAMAARGNQLADQMLQFRQLAREINKRKKRQESKDSGTYVRSVHTVKRSAPSVKVTPSPPQQQEKESSSPQSRKEAQEQATMFERNDPLLLIDASAYIFRAYYAFPPMHRSDGMPIGALLGFCNMLNRLVLTTMMEGKQPRIVLVFDAPGKTFRHDIYDLYKANRQECPVDLVPQFALIREAAKAYGIAQIEAPTFEADDVIATLASMALREGIDCNILSGDKDLMQLVTPTDISPSVQMIDPMTMSRVTYEDVVAKWGVAPEKLGDVLALAGDSADNVPGVPGIGPKIAADLLTSFGSLENLLENADEVKQKGRREKLQSNIEQARLSRVLVELERNVPMDQMTFPVGLDKVTGLRMAPMDADNLSRFFDEMGLRDLKRRFLKRLEIQRGVPPTIPTARKQPARSRFAPRPKATIPKPEDFSDVPF